MSEQPSKQQAIDLIAAVWPHKFHTPPPADMAMEAEYRDVEALAINSFAAGKAAGEAERDALRAQVAVMIEQLRVIQHTPECEFWSGTYDDPATCSCPIPGMIEGAHAAAAAWEREVERRVLLEVKKEGWELRNSWKNCTTPELEAIDKRLAALAPSAPVDAKGEGR